MSLVVCAKNTDNMCVYVGISSEYEGHAPGFLSTSKTLYQQVDCNPDYGYILDNYPKWEIKKSVFCIVVLFTIFPTASN